MSDEINRINPTVVEGAEDIHGAETFDADYSPLNRPAFSWRDNMAQSRRTLDKKQVGDMMKMRRMGKGMFDAQGYNDKLDESMGMSKKESKMEQSMKDRRDESKGMEKGMGRRAYQRVGTMDAEGIGSILGNVIPEPHFVGFEEIQREKMKNQNTKDAEAFDAEIKYDAKIKLNRAKDAQYITPSIEEGMAFEDGEGVLQSSYSVVSEAEEFGAEVSCGNCGSALVMNAEGEHGCGCGTEMDAEGTMLGSIGEGNDFGQNEAEEFGAERRYRYGNRYITRDSKGRFKKNVSVGRSLSADRRRKAKTVKGVGQGGKGDYGAESFEAESERITVRDLEGNTYSLKRINEVQLNELMDFGDSRAVSDRMFFVDGSNGVAFPEGMRAWWFGGLDYDKPKTKVIDDEGNKYDMWERYLMEEENDGEDFEDTNVYMRYLIPFFRDENDEPYSREERERRGFMFRAESKFDELADEIAEQYEKKGKSKEEAEKIGKATAYKVGVAKYGKRGMTNKAKAGMRKKKMGAEDEEDEEDWEYHVYVSDSPNSIGSIEVEGFEIEEEAIKEAHEVSKDERGKGKTVYVVAEEREMGYEEIIYEINEDRDVMGAEETMLGSIGEGNDFGQMKAEEDYYTRDATFVCPESDCGCRGCYGCMGEDENPNCRCCGYVFKDGPTGMGEHTTYQCSCGVRACDGCIGEDDPTCPSCGIVFVHTTGPFDEQGNYIGSAEGDVVDLTQGVLAKGGVRVGGMTASAIVLAIAGLSGYYYARR